MAGNKPVFIERCVCERERELLYRDEGWKDEEIE
jgi:hypothetical protein